MVAAEMGHEGVVRFLLSQNAIASTQNQVRGLYSRMKMGLFCRERLSLIGGAGRGGGVEILL